MLNYQQEHSMPLRVCAALLIGVVVSGFLTWFMYFLIQTGDPQLDESKRSFMLDFVRIKRDEVSQKKERMPEKAPVEKAPPAPDMPDLDNDQNVDAIPISDLAGDAGLDFNMDGFSIGAGDGEYLPIVKVVPVYPFSALNDWVEGECTVAYTVTTNGSTKDIRVIRERCPYKAFRKPSIAAAKKFKYKPKVINGEAIEVHNVINTFIFEIHRPEES